MCDALPTCFFFYTSYEKKKKEYKWTNSIATLFLSKCYFFNGRAWCCIAFLLANRMQMFHNQVAQSVSLLSETVILNLSSQVFVHAVWLPMAFPI